VQRDVRVLGGLWRVTVSGAGFCPSLSWIRRVTPAVVVGGLFEEREHAVSGGVVGIPFPPVIASRAAMWVGERPPRRYSSGRLMVYAPQVKVDAVISSVVAECAGSTDGRHANARELDSAGRDTSRAALASWARKAWTTCGSPG